MRSDRPIVRMARDTSIRAQADPKNSTGPHTLQGHTSASSLCRNEKRYLSAFVFDS